MFEKPSVAKGHDTWTVGRGLDCLLQPLNDSPRFSFKKKEVTASPCLKY